MAFTLKDKGICITRICKESVILVYKVLQIAEWFSTKESMSHEKLQKLCYYSQAWCYALHNKPLMDTGFEAWMQGPISPELYEAYKENGFELIGSKNGELNFAKEHIKLLERVWKTYGELTANALVALSQSEYPWIIARSESKLLRCDTTIDPKMMKKYFLSIYSKEK